MTDLLIFAVGAAAGYVLAIHSWTRVRTFIVGVEQELLWIKTRAAELEAKVRDALGRGEH
ncbi:MAG: hypothetical protein QOG83_84 [Alphaproteobacteria bacterium]|jgi:hypothetical protein|nr:hypothetical protein [Alphaproteobacteria bacterium]MEA2937727.1 hypothetical protein [Alphaproteobacteria bacterium]MEA2987373.1 hypothetical protein [Alphaproteobacteria bacterium]